MDIEPQECGYCRSHVGLLNGGRSTLFLQARWSVTWGLLSDFPLDMSLLSRVLVLP